jgi:hypothetical protein
MIGQQVSVAADLHHVGSRAGSLVEELEADLGSFGSKGIHLIWITLPQLVSLDVLARKESVLESVCDGIRMIGV